MELSRLGQLSRHECRAGLRGGDPTHLALHAGEVGQFSPG